MTLFTVCWGGAVVAVTVAVTVQEPPAASVPPAKERLLGAVRVSVPPHWAEVPLVTVRPAGSVSVKVIPLAATPGLGLVIVKVRVEVPPTGTGLGEKPLLSVGGCGTAQPVKTTSSR